MPQFLMPPVVLLLQLLLTCAASHVVSGPHLADVNVLLPPKMTHAVEYRLQGSDGCFKWSWDHHDILSVLPKYNSTSHCSTSARLKSIAPYSGRKETAVYATDVHTGVVIRCKIYIDIFSRIQIFHSSIKLDLDGLATLRVRAFDKEENVFSSLVGLQFMWQLLPELDGLSHNLAHVPLKDSPLSDCGGLCGDLNVQIKLEDSGVFSDLYVVKGAGIGHEIVTVRSIEPQLEVMADKIILTVAEAMSIEPISPVFVLIGASFRYTLKVIRSNAPQIVPLPSPFHRWSASNLSVAQVDTMLGEVLALTLGETIIIVEDTRVDGHYQMSSLHVVVPGTLSMYISPLSLLDDLVKDAKPVPSGLPWYIIFGEQYLIQVKVFSQGPGAREIYLTENDDVKLDNDKSEHWNIFPVDEGVATKHGQWNSKILKATSCGQGSLMATLDFYNADQQDVLEITQEVIVCDRVKFSMEYEIGSSQRILLPWVPDVNQEVHLKAVGGCALSPSDYKWVSSDVTIVSVSNLGFIQARKPGKANIKVISLFDSFNYDEVVVEVLVPSSMIMLQNFPVETVVGSYLQASVTLEASSGAYFYRCDAFRPLISWKTGSESFTIVNATGGLSDQREFSKFYDVSSNGPPCSWTRIYAHGSGHTTLHATLAKEYHYFDHSFTGSILLKASSRIAAYLPLIVQQAGNGNQFGGYWSDLAEIEARDQLENFDELYLAPRTQMDVLLHGGPYPWDEHVNFIEKVETLVEGHVHHNDGIFFYQLSNGSRSQYRISCQKLGTFKLLFRRGNLVGKDHPFPSVAEVSLSIVCSFPSSIVVLTDEVRNTPEVIQTAIQAERSPGRLRATPIIVANGRTIRTSAVGIADSGRAFGNSSSLSVSWELNNCDGLAFWDERPSLAAVKSSWEKFLVLQNASGVCDIRATVIGCADSLSYHDSCSLLDFPESGLTDAIRLQLVSNLRIYPEFNLLLCSPDSRSNLSITGGSCLLESIVNDSKVLEALKPSIKCSELVIVPKGLGTAVVTVYDIGITPPLATSSVVQVADVDWIKINSLEEISLMNGTFLPLNISAGINDGTVFDSSQYMYMKISVHIENHVVEVVDQFDFPIPVDQYLKAPSFIVWTKHVGMTSLYVSARQQSGHEILSQPINIEVYAPPAITPNDMFLVPGASYVLTVRGGPRVGAYIEYASMNDQTATIDKLSGCLHAISPGFTSFVAMIYGNGGNIICQAQGRVKVGVPYVATLISQSEKIAVSREMPIIPSLSEGNLFSFYELCRNYKWTIENEAILGFRVAGKLYDKEYDPQFDTAKEVSSIGYLDENNLGFIQLLYGKSAGWTDIAISFTCDFVSASYSETRSYSASTSMWVESDLPLALGTHFTWILPPYYTTSNLLPSSSTSHDQDDVQNRKGKVTYSLLKECGGKNEEFRSNTIYIDGRKIKTLESGSIACILAKDRLTRRVEVATCVRVAEAAQIRIATNDLPIRSMNLAVGAEVNLPVNFHDVLGNPFHEAYDIATVNVETNYPDVILVKGTLNKMGSVCLKAMHPGRALVRISFDSQMQKCDYLMITVGAHLYPENPVLRIGNHLNFSIEGLDNEELGQWVSANGSVIIVDAHSGKAEAVGEGRALVIFQGSELKFQTVVTVLGGSSLSIDAPKGTLTNVPFPSKGYGFAVKFSNDYKKKEVLGDDMAAPYNCKVEPSFVGFAKPWQDGNSGNSYCLFFPFPPAHLVHSIPKSIDKRHGIYVSLNASLDGTNDISGSASALFIGGFSILEMDQDSLHLNLTSASTKAIITVVGNTYVEVNWHNQNYLSITPVHREDSGIGGFLRYEVRALGAERFKDKVIITLPATYQRAEIDVSFEPQDSKGVATISSSSLWAAAVGCFTLLLVTVAIFICFLDKPYRSRTSATPAPAVTTPTTPRSVRADVKDQSPRTPQPFIDYVKRTIDETPYYRQEVRRRFNPQNTF